MSIETLSEHPERASRTMIKIPITTKEDKMKLFNLFKKKELEGLDKALGMGLITEEEKLKIAVARATETLDKFLEKKGRPKHQPPKKSGL